METQTLERPGPDAPEEERDPTETPPDQPATPEPDGPDKPQDAPGGDPQPGAETDEDLSMEGDEGYLNTEAGGKAPTDSKLAIVGRDVRVEGQVKKGTRIRAMVEFEIGDVSFRDTKDKQTGQVVACTRKHSASIVGFAKQP